MRKGLRADVRYAWVCFKGSTATATSNCVPCTSATERRVSVCVAAGGRCRHVSLIAAAAANNGRLGRRDKQHRQATAMLCLACDDDGSVEKMLEGHRWTGLDGSADDESRAEKHERRDDDVLERALSALAAPWNEAFSWPGGLLPLAGFRNRNCGCVATASRSLAHF